ncbi:MAG: hypothetical protein ACQETJ_06905 [Bacteroidota bacterium]
MGISIHYKGKLDSPKLVKSFCEEVQDIAQSMEWEFTVIGPELKDKNGLKGLIIKPHEKAELLQFAFDKKGYLRNALLLEYENINDNYTFFNHIKTQFAPIEIHVAVIKLLKYLKEKYMHNLEVNDEGLFWETGDIDILKEKTYFLAKAINDLGDVLDSIPFEKGDNAESIADKIEKIIRKKLDKRK